MIPNNGAVLLYLFTVFMLSVLFPFGEYICLKLYLWPYLSYLANIKGFCPQTYRPPSFFPIITLPPGATLSPPISTFQPTPPTNQPTPPTLFPTPTFPTPPVTQTGFPPTQTPLPSTFQPTPPTIQPTPPTNQPTPPTNQPTPPTIQPTPPTLTPPTGTTCPLYPVICLPGGQSPIANCPCIDPRNRQVGPIGSDMMVFSSLAQICFDSNSQRGNCMNLARCPHLLEDFYEQARRYPDGVDFQTFVSQSICGFDGFNFLICCTFRRKRGNLEDFQQPPPVPQRNPWDSQPSSTLFHFAALSNQIDSTSVINPIIETTIAPVPTNRPTPPVPITTRVPPPPVVLNPVSSTPIPVPSGSITARYSNCGISGGATNRVVGGMEAKRGSYPWVVALGYYEPSDPTVLKFFCGGSLISNTYVITSAHCINTDLKLIRLGAHDLSKMESTAIDIKIKRKVVHEKFDLKTISNDIALIQLNNAVAFTEFIRPVCLPEDSKFMQQDFVGSNPFVAGWGSVQYQGASSNVLRDTQVPIISTKTCMSNYSIVFKTTDMTSTLICAGNSRVDACQGDSGGPLMMPQLEGKIFRYYLIGIVSYGYECARSGFPGVYTRVAAYIQWIKKNMT